MPKCFLPFYKCLYVVRQGILALFRNTATFFYYGPMFRAKCREVGKGLNYIKLRQGFPFFHGNIRIDLGDNVTVHSRSSFSAANVFDAPVLRVGKNTYLGPGLSIGVGKEISIGSNCYIASNVEISDNDGHPLEPGRRVRGESVEKDRFLPVRILDNVWIGDGAIILKNVHIGEGAIIAARSVVVSDVDPFTIVAGNPASRKKTLDCTR